MSNQPITPGPPCHLCQERWEHECKEIRHQMAYWRDVLGIHDTIPFPPQPRDCYHNILDTMIFNTPQRKPQPPRSPQAGPNFLDILDDNTFSKILSAVIECSNNYSKSLISISRMTLAYRRAYVMEKNIQYGDLVLSCDPALVPPPSWFHQRRSRIKSITSATLPGELEDALHEVARHTLSVSFCFSRRESGESSKIRTFSASIINSNPKVGIIATSKGWLIQGKGKLTDLENESRDLAHIATKLVAVAIPDAEDNFMSESGSNLYLMNTRASLAHLLCAPLLTERLGLPDDFGFNNYLQGTLVFEDVKVEAPHHGNLFGLLLMRSTILHAFKDAHPSRANIVLCWACPPQFHYMRNVLSIRGDPTARAVELQAELWSKGMLRDGRLYSRESAARSQTCVC
jgi:hypothetical protein